MAFDRATMTEAMKDFYLPAVREQLVNKNEYLAQIEKNDEDIRGLKAVIDLHVGRNFGFGARKEGEDLPPPGQQAYKKEEVNLKYDYIQIQVSGPALRTVNATDAGWVDPLDSETKGAVQDKRWDEQRQLLGTSDGVLAACGVTSASTTVVTTATVTQKRFLKPGLRIDIGTVASPTAVAQNRTIQSVSGSNIVISGAAVTTATTDRIFVNGNGGSGADQREATGVQTIVDSTGTLFGVDPTTYTDWASYEKDAAAAALSEALIGELIDEVDLNGPSGVPTWGFSTHAQVRAFGATFASQKQLVNTVDLKGGFSGIAVSTGAGVLAVSALRDAPVSQFYAVNTEHLIYFEASDWEWMEEDGAVLTRDMSGNGKDAYRATLFHYREQGTDQRNAHGKIVNLAGAY